MYCFPNKIAISNYSNVPSSTRPETVESLFIAFRLTGDVRYRDHGWRIFQSIEKHCRVETGGYTTVLNVDEVPPKQDDKMESFFMVCDMVNHPC
jgi:hypothetical protein